MKILKMLQGENFPPKDEAVLIWLDIGELKIQRDDALSIMMHNLIQN